MSPMAKMPGVVLSNFAVSTAIRFSVRFSPKSAMGPSLMVSPKNGMNVSQACSHSLLVGVGERHGAKLAVVAVQRLHAGDLEIDLAVGRQLAHLVDAVLRGAEAVAVMDEGELGRDRREIDRPVERAVAAAGDQDVLAAERVHLAHRVVHGLAFIGFDAGDGRTLRHEASAAGRDDNDRAP